MATELVPVVDLRVLSQDDLAALAAASPHAFDPRRCPDSDLLPPPKIDRSVFNESAGSRKQTFSRLRLAPPSPHLPSSSSSPAAAATAAAGSGSGGDDESENHLIVSHLRRLFARDDPFFLPTPPPTPPPPQTLALDAPPKPSLPPPPPPEASSLALVVVTDPDREEMNANGVAVDLVKLGELVDPFSEELRRRTAGLGSESELLAFMNGLDGQWGSRRRRRKFVDAAAFGDHLPRGWKLLLGLKRKEGVAWINCRRYVSPKGHQFATCKEVSSYLMSLLGYPEAKPVAVQSNMGTGVHDSGADRSIGFHQQNDSMEEKQSVLPVTSVSLSPDCQKQEPLHISEKQVGTDAANAQECQKCNLTFHDQSAYMQHQLSFHQRSTKRRRVGKSGEAVVGKDGKFECPLCHKTFEERSRYFGHVGAHVRYQGLSPEALLDETFSGKVVSQSSSAAVSCGLQEMTHSAEQKEEICAAEPTSEHHNNSMNNFDDQEAHDVTRCSAEEVLAVKPASELHQIKSTNNHQSNNSKISELSCTNCSDSFNRPDDTCCRSEEVPPTADAPSASKYNDPMYCADVTESKEVSQSTNQLDSKFNGFAEVADVNDRAGSHSLSATLEDPDLKSADMEVDDSNITCKYDEVVKATSFENGTLEDPDLKSADMEVDDNNITCKYDEVLKATSFENGNRNEDQAIDCGMAACKPDEINDAVKIKDVNLNSCLEISSPITDANDETSTAFNEASQSSISAKCFGTSFNNTDGSACKAEHFVNNDSTMVYQSNLSMEPISPTQINVDCFTACSMTSELENNCKEQIVAQQNCLMGHTECQDNGKEQTVDTHNLKIMDLSSNEAGYDVEAYNNDIFTRAITENSLAQLNNTINDLKTDFSSCYSLSELNTLTDGTSADELDVNCMRNSFVNGSIGRNGPNEHCTLDIDIKGSMLEAMEKSDNELENRYNGGAPGCDPLVAAGTSGDIDDLMSMQVNFGSLSSLVRSVDDVPIGSMLQDQCDLQLGFGGQKQQMFPGFEDLRLASAGSSQFGSLSRQNSVPVPEPTLMLGYAPQLGSCPPVQLGWDLSLSKMVTGCTLTSVCVWCNNQFHHFSSVAEQQADSLGFICPTCKEKISGHLSILNNGSSQL